MTIEKGHNIVLMDKKGKKYIIRVTGEPLKVEGLGVVDTSKMVGSPYGEPIGIGNASFLPLEASISDSLDTLRRKAQIMVPKDSVQLLYLCNIRSGSTVVEGGAGSGAATLVLAHGVHPNGKVVTYELRGEFKNITRSNLRRAGLDELVTFKDADIREGIEENGVDAVVLDIPDPWEAVEHAHRALKPGGYLAAYCPTMNQTERTVKTMEGLPFIEIKNYETLQREMVVGERGTRPSFDMLGHTGYITIARKVSKTLDQGSSS